MDPETTPPEAPDARRPLKSRNLAVFQAIAARLASAGVSPNAISISSVVFGAGAGALLAMTGEVQGGWGRGCWLGAAGLIQLRLLANMFDGMVAVEGGKGSPVGDLYNEAPDRISDAAILIGAGYALGSAPWLGWLAAVVALIVAYLRALGASTGIGQAFHGPMAKPQRMFAMTVGCLYLGLTPAAWQPLHEATGWGIVAGVLGIIVVGGLITCVRRWRWVSRELKKRST